MKNPPRSGRKAPTNRYVRGSSAHPMPIAFCVSRIRFAPLALKSSFAFGNAESDGWNRAAPIFFEW
jgi:hypothetical protein